MAMKNSVFEEAPSTGEYICKDHGFIFLQSFFKHSHPHQVKAKLKHLCKEDSPDPSICNCCGKFESVKVIGSDQTIRPLIHTNVPEWRKHQKRECFGSLWGICTTLWVTRQTELVGLCYSSHCMTAAKQRGIFGDHVGPFDMSGILWYSAGLWVQAGAHSGFSLLNSVRTSIVKHEPN